MNTWGVVNSFGAFQSYYVNTLRHPPSDISWIGSIEVFLLLFVGTPTGRLTDAGFFRPVAIVGSVLAVVGTFTTSVCTQYWQVFLAQGVCVGLGNGCLFCPAVAIISTYFSKRRSLVIGITACGSGVGGIIYPLMVRELLPRVGFGWTLRSIAFTQTGLLAIALLCMKPRVVPRKTGPWVDWAAFKEPEYSFYTLAAFTVYLGSYFAFFYISSYARDIRGLSYSESLNLIVVMNGVGFIGRLLPTYLADRHGSLTLFVPTAAAGALLAYCWIAVASAGAALYAWAAVCGAALGGIQALFPAAVASLTADPRKQGTRIGMVFTIASFSVLIGPPIAGAIITAQGGRYVGAQVFSGSCMAVGTVLMVMAREAKRRRVGGGLWAKV